MGKVLFVGKVLGYTVLYGVVIYRLAMNEEEKEKIRGIAGKSGKTVENRQKAWGFLPIFDAGRTMWIEYRNQLKYYKMTEYNV